MRLALVHDWLTNLAGAERVILALHEQWPEAPIFTSLYDPTALPPEYGPDRLDVRTAWLQRIPGAASHWRWLMPLMPGAFESFDLGGYDVVLSSAHACAKGVITRAETCHLCYCYTPIRYVWEMPGEYLAEAPPWMRPLFALLQRRLRLWDYTAAQRVDRFIAISETVRRRIEKHYRRSADVIYPPVDTGRFAPAPERDDYYLVVSRLVGYKRVALAAAACAELGRPLKIVGVGPEEAAVRAAAGPDVELRGWRSDEEVRELMSRARALIFAGIEDFGLTPVEAQAAGCPVIAFGQGGATETVVDGETGLFFAEPTVASLVDAVRRFEAVEWEPARCAVNARRFDRSVFDQRIGELVPAAWAEHQAALGRGAR
ncbi:MAG: glycosyltransferase [Armatimonadetes bacterium]|nr:glycosyltransferase [Armatimonadota bacterium]